mmetsp:Transcript_21364/g.36403  ORF Transcript_21364/g.36403 Transcript_21364/m.36403 type:complete len:268 (+) Transcript_21364:79-882(+)|eukprot:CAMPEP_0119107794 /NCGR_PEP_ID=MMETSP1180-20130426/11606_1 /TAXON_ID=3052 ORGANISM="Chlamydomonas cf sp, Strain CCMP681" /NCGR_SAMPLE_ID=MMETSP1180 /ASSEMBLY_ACC=CAM_ASM_000741 /LENGTH=267 /DNA_ID=CAMNT_0007093335 /DNA_START=70 /DNA_END=873 /DNA_ORIENTATION=-
MHSALPVLVPAGSSSSCRHLVARPCGQRRSQGRQAALPMNRRSAHTALGTLGSLALIGGSLGVAGLVRAATATPAKDPRQLVSTGMQKFRRNDVEGAVEDLDAAWAAAPSLRPYLWQRGLALYYLGRYEEAGTQFRSDVAVNPNDTEEAIWAYIAEARILGPEAASKQFLEVGRDSRPIMRAAYQAFQGAGPDKIKVAITDDSGGTCFYGNLYIALWHEAQGSLQEAEARVAMEAACATQYAQTSGDYMAALARVHCKRRGWNAGAE